VNFKFTRGRLVGEVAPPSQYRRFCGAAEQRFETILGAGLADQPALASILRAMMMGQKQLMSEDQQKLFMHSGTMHLFAISGLNITAIALSVQILLALLRTPASGGRGLQPRRPLALRGHHRGKLLCGARILDECAHGHLILVSTPRKCTRDLVRGGAVGSPARTDAAFRREFSDVVRHRGGSAAAGSSTGQRTRHEVGLVHRPARIDVALVSSSGRRCVALASRDDRDRSGLGAGQHHLDAAVFGLVTPGSLAINLVLIPLPHLSSAPDSCPWLCGLVGFGAGSVLFNHAAAVLIWFMDELLRFTMALPGVYRTAQIPRRLDWTGNSRHLAGHVPCGICMALAAGAGRLLAALRPDDDLDRSWYEAGAVMALTACRAVALAKASSVAGAVTPAAGLR